MSVRQVAAAELPAAVAAWARAQRARRWVVPDGVPDAWLAHVEGLERVARRRRARRP